MNIPSLENHPELFPVIRHAVEQGNEGFTIADATKPELPLIFVNQAFCEITGYSAEEAVGNNCRFLQGENTDSFVVEQIRDAIRLRDKCTVELVNYTKGGKPFWNRLSLVPVFSDCGDLTHYVGIQSDLTYIKVYERQQEQFRAMRATMESVNDIVVNYLAILHLYRDKRVEELSQAEKLLKQFETQLDRTQGRLEKLNKMEAYEETSLASGIVGLDWEKKQ